jgi:uncharacterized protein
MGPGAPEHMYLLTGDRAVHAHRVAEFLPILATVRDRLLARLREPAALPTPLWGPPCAACEGCGYAALCADGRAAARHLSLVAGLRTDQARKLGDAGITTIDALAEATDDDRPGLLPRHTFTRLRAQAALQVRQDATRRPDDPQGTVIAEVYAEEGLAGLPAPSPGDVFFDMEGYPYFDGADGRGLEYLFGAVTTADDPLARPGEGEPAGGGGERFHAFWAHDRTAEKRAFEEFVDFATARVDADPGAHVYHYASYEADRLKLLSATFATREAEVDELLRHRRLVDLFTVVKKSLRVSQRSYSIKYLEPLYLRGSRAGEVTTATSSIDAYAEYAAAQEAGDTDRAAKVLADIADYNRDDCVSTARLRDWLEDLRAEHGITARPLRQDELAAEDDDERAAERRRRREEQEARLRALTDPLLDGVPPDPAARTPDDAARALLAALAGYYRREENPSWWDYFRRVSAPMEELEADTDCLVPLRVLRGDWQEPTGRQRVWPAARSNCAATPSAPTPSAPVTPCACSTPARPGRAPTPSTPPSPPPPPTASPWSRPEPPARPTPAPPPPSCPARPCARLPRTRRCGSWPPRPPPTCPPCPTPRASTCCAAARRAPATAPACPTPPSTAATSSPPSSTPSTGSTPPTSPCRARPAPARPTSPPASSPTWWPRAAPSASAPPATRPSRTS